MDNRLTMVEQHLAVLANDVSSLRANCATKADLAVVGSTLSNLEANCATKADLAVVESRLSNLEANCATKADLASLRADLFMALNAQTWKLVSSMAVIAATVYFIARNVH